MFVVVVVVVARTTPTLTPRVTKFAGGCDSGAGGGKRRVGAGFFGTGGFSFC